MAEPVEKQIKSMWHSLWHLNVSYADLSFILLGSIEYIPIIYHDWVIWLYTSSHLSIFSAYYSREGRGGRALRYFIYRVPSVATIITLSGYRLTSASRKHYRCTKLRNNLIKTTNSLLLSQLNRFSINLVLNDSGEIETLNLVNHRLEISYINS